MQIQNLQNGVNVTSDVKSIVEDPELVSKRRSQLIQASITCFSNIGYHSTTVKEIAKLAGVSPGLVYQYVPDKQDLLFIALRYIVQTNLQEIPAAVADLKDPLQKVHAAVEAYSRVIALNREAVVLTYRETKSLKPEYIQVMKQLELDTNALIVPWIDESIEAGFIRPCNTELLVYRIIMASHTWALKHWRLSKIIKLPEYLEQCVHACWIEQLTAKGQTHYKRLLAKLAATR